MTSNLIDGLTPQGPVIRAFFMATRPILFQTPINPMTEAR